MKYGTLLGSEGAFARSMFCDCYMGINIAGETGITSNSYGCNAPHVQHYRLTDWNIGTNLSYRLFHLKNCGMVFSIAGYPEIVDLCDYSLFHDFNTHTTYYHSVSTNIYNSLRPGVGFYIGSRLMPGISYNNHVGFSTFRNPKDFQGYQVLILWNTNSKFLNELLYEH